MIGKLTARDLFLILPDGRSVVEIDPAGWTERLLPHAIHSALIVLKGSADERAIPCDLQLLPTRRTVTGSSLPAQLFLRLPIEVSFSDLVGLEFELSLASDAVLQPDARPAKNKGHSMQTSDPIEAWSGDHQTRTASCLDKDGRLE